VAAHTTPLVGEEVEVKIAIIGAGSVAFTPALVSGFGTDARYRGARIALVDVDERVLDLVTRFARRVSDELALDWQIEASTQRREVLPGADVVTTAIGVGGLDAWVQDVEIPRRYGIVQPVGDTSGPGGLARALRHIPVLVEIARDMSSLCPEAVLYNFTNPLTVITQAVLKRTAVHCIGLCIGPESTWSHICRVVGVEKARTHATIGGINHCHWILDYTIDGRDGFPALTAALDSATERPEGGQPLCAALYRCFGAYPGPGDGHVGEFYPQLARATVSDLETYHGHAIRNVRKTYPALSIKMTEIADGRAPIDARSFAEELSWEHTQLLDLMVARQDDRGEVFHVNVLNRGCISSLPDDVVVEVPARVDAAGVHPISVGDLPAAVLPTLLHKTSTLDLIVEAALEGSRAKAAQAFVNDPHCTDVAAGVRLVNELIDAQLSYLPRFR
jgi:alpha-galactosidase